MNELQQELFDTYIGLASRVAAKYSARGRDDEIDQESLIALHKAVLAHDPARGAFGPFAWTVMENHILSFLKQRSRHEGAELTILDEAAGEEPGEARRDAIPDESPDPARAAVRSEAFAQLRVGMEAATPGQKDLLEHYARGGSFAEWARETGVSEQAVRQQFERAKESVRTRMEERFGFDRSPIKLLPADPNPMRVPQVPDFGRLHGSHEEPPGCLKRVAVFGLVLAIGILIVVLLSNS